MSFFCDDWKKWLETKDENIARAREFLAQLMPFGKEDPFVLTVYSMLPKAKSALDVDETVFEKKYS